MKNIKKFGAAIIGCGLIHKVHADAIMNNPQVLLISVVDIDEKKAKAAAAEYNCSFYTDYRDMLRNEEIDVVHICTPHYLHASMAIEAMRSGKHVLTEKPMAICVRDALEMIKLSRETGKKLGICFQNRYNTTSLKIKEFLESDKAGRILGAKAFMTWFRNEKYYSESEWKGTWEKEGGGVLINQAIHTLDLLQWFLGDIDKIKGNTDTRLLNEVIEVEDTAEATILFKNGAVASFYATNCYRSDSPVEIEIVCENATLKLANELVIFHKTGDEEHIRNIDMVTGQKAYWGSGHKALIDHYYTKLAENKEIFIDGLSGITALKMVEAIYTSSKSGQYNIF